MSSSYSKADSDRDVTRYLGTNLNIAAPGNILTVQLSILPPMKLSKALSLLTDLRFAITIAILPTLRDVFHNPTLLVRPQALSRVFMAHLWLVYGPGSDLRSRDIKNDLIKPNAYGSVLDVGAGWCFSFFFLYFFSVVS